MHGADSRGPVSARDRARAFGARRVVERARGCGIVRAAPAARRAKGRADRRSGRADCAPRAGSISVGSLRDRTRRGAARPSAHVGAARGVSNRGAHRGGPPPCLRRGGDLWGEIASLCAWLEQLRPTPGVRGSRVFTLGKSKGSAAALALLNQRDIDAPSYPCVYLVRGALLGSTPRREGFTP